MRRLVTLVVGLLPASTLKNLLLRVCGHRIDPSARISPCLFWGVATIDVAAASVGPFNVFRDLRCLVLADGASIGQWNWFSASPEHRQGRGHRLTLARGAAVTSRHYFDCTGGITIGEMAIVAGHRSTLLSHQIDLAESVQEYGPIDVGAYSFVGSNCVLTMNATLPERSLLTAMSLLTSRSAQDRRSGVWSGQPAVFIKEVDGEFFTRSSPYVHPRQ